MANQPALNATVKITSKDINGNSIAKQYSTVGSVYLDFNKGMVCVVDGSGPLYFPLIPVTTVTYTITANPGGQHAIVIS
jgi:hypothetical protein